MSSTPQTDKRQLEMMWNFLKMGVQKPNVPALKELCATLRQAMLQKTAGQRADKPNDVDFDDVPTIVNCIVIEAMCLYLSGWLDEKESEMNEC